MKRRDFVKAAFAVPASVIAKPSRVRKYGRLGVEAHTAHTSTTGEFLHVYLDGVDVTDSCHMADDVAGEVVLFCRDRDEHRRWDAKGALHVGDDGRVCRLRLNGNVVMKPGPRT